MNNFPTEAQMGETANSGAAVAQSALARKQGSKNKSDQTAAPAATVVAPQPLQIPSGTDGKTYRKYQRRTDIYLAPTNINMMFHLQLHRMFRSTSMTRLPGSTTILQPVYITIPIHNTITTMKPALTSTGIMRQAHTL